MTLNSALIADGFREQNFTAQGGTLTDSEQTEGLQILQGLVDSFFGSVVGVRPEPWWIPFPNYTAPKNIRWPAKSPNGYDAREVNYPPPNSRVMLRTTTAETIYLQAQPEDGAMMEFVDAGFEANVTLDGNGMFFETTGANRTVTLTSTIGANTRVPTKRYVFRADTASWNLMSDLIYAGEMPFPSIFDDYWRTALAIRLAPRFGKTKPETVARYGEMTVFIRNYYAQMRDVVIGDVGNAMQSYEPGVGFGNFNTGAL